MPPIETHDLVDYAVLWRADGVGVDGETQVSDTPEEIRLDIGATITQSGQSQTDEKSIDATAFTEREVEVGSVLLVGKLSEIQGSSWTEGDRQKLFEVVRYSEETDLKGRFTAYELGLRRYRGPLPTRTTS